MWPLMLKPEALPADGARHTLRPPAEALPDIAARLGLEALIAFDCGIEASPRPGGAVLVRGTLAARVRQICVVGLEPFEADVRDRFTILFDPAAGAADYVPHRGIGEGLGEELGEGLAGGLAGDDPWPEPLEGEIDLAELAIQQLSLALDPHPRAPGAVAEAPENARETVPGTDPETGLRRPFAGLDALLKRDK